MAASAASRAVPSQFAIADLLAGGVDRLGLTLSKQRQQMLMDYLRLLAKWGATFNLTAVRDPADMLAVHLLDSLSIVPLLDALDLPTVIDIGSGAGLPGIPLAIARPAWTVQTVDAVAKKISFQRQVRAELGVSNLIPTHDRVEALTSSSGPTVIVSRAYASLANMLGSIRSMTNDHTVVVAMKGAIPADELAALPTGWGLRAVHELDVPFLGAQRCAVVLARDVSSAGARP